MYIKSRTHGTVDKGVGEIQWHTQRAWVQYPVKAVEDFQKGTGDNWHPLNMARGTRTVYPSKQNKGLSSTFQPLKEGRSIQRTKLWDKHGDKDEDNHLKNVIKGVSVNNENIFFLKKQNRFFFW